MPGIGIITNPHSKLNKRDPNRIRLLGYILGEQGTIAVTQSLEHLEEVAQRFKSNNIDILAINGGDGTISQTLSVFVRVYDGVPLPKIAVLRGGTMNVLAVNLGIKGSPEKILALLLEVASSPEALTTSKVNSLMVDGRVGFVYADGTVTKILEEFYKNKTGTLGAVWLGIKLVCSALFNGELFKRTIVQERIEFAANGFPTQTHSSLGVLAATIRKLPLGLPFFGLINENSTLFQTISVTSNPEKLLWHLPLVMLQNKEHESLGKLSFCTDRLRVTGSGPIRYTLDGELYESTGSGVELKLGPVIEFINL